MSGTKSKVTNGKSWLDVATSSKTHVAKTANRVLEHPPSARATVEEYITLPRIGRPDRASGPVIFRNLEAYRNIVENPSAEIHMPMMIKVSVGTSVFLVLEETDHISAVGTVGNVKEYSSVDEFLKIHPDYSTSTVGYHGPVVSFNFSSVVEIYEKYVTPPEIEGQVLFDTRHLFSNHGRMATISVHATNLDAIRHELRSSDDHSIELKSHALNATTSIVIQQFLPDSHVTIPLSFNSAPTIVYINDPHMIFNSTLIGVDGAKFNLAKRPVIVTKGVEAIKCTILRAFRRGFVIYERQIEQIDMSMKDDTFVCESVICSGNITRQILAAMNTLLFNDGDCATIMVYAPETAVMTSNTGPGWFVSEGNIPHERILNGIQTNQIEDVSFNSRNDAITYLAAHWRNFLHVRLENGNQIVIMHSRAQYAKSIVQFPLSRVNLSECRQQGLMYLENKIAECAMNEINNCSRIAVLSDVHGQNGPPKRSLFFDHDCELRLSSLMNILRSNFIEEVDDMGKVHFHIDIDFTSSLDSTPPYQVQYSYMKSAPQLLAEPNGGRKIYEGYMERFVRNLISTIYVYYGSNASNSHLFAHMIFKNGIAFIEERKTIYNFISNHITFLEHDSANYSEPFKLVWNRIVRGSGGERIAEVQKKERLIAYIMNRPHKSFSEIREYLYGAAVRAALNVPQKPLAPPPPQLPKNVMVQKRPPKVPAAKAPSSAPSINRRQAEHKLTEIAEKHYPKDDAHRRVYAVMKNQTHSNLIKMLKDEKQTLAVLATAT